MSPRLPDEEMIAGRLTNRVLCWQHRGLDAAGIAKAFHDEAIGIGKLLLSLQLLGDIDRKAGKPRRIAVIIALNAHHRIDPDLMIIRTQDMLTKSHRLIAAFDEGLHARL